MRLLALCCYTNALVNTATDATVAGAGVDLLLGSHNADRCAGGPGRTGFWSPKLNNFRQSHRVVNRTAEQIAPGSPMTNRSIIRADLCAPGDQQPDFIRKKPSRLVPQSAVLAQRRPRALPSVTILTPHLMGSGQMVFSPLNRQISGRSNPGMRAPKPGMRAPVWAGAILAPSSLLPSPQPPSARRRRRRPISPGQ